MQFAAKGKQVERNEGFLSGIEIVAILRTTVEGKRVSTKNYCRENRLDIYLTKKCDRVLQKFDSCIFNSDYFAFETIIMKVKCLFILMIFCYSVALKHL